MSTEVGTTRACAWARRAARPPWHPLGRLGADDPQVHVRHVLRLRAPAERTHAPRGPARRAAPRRSTPSTASRPCRSASASPAAIRRRSGSSNSSACSASTRRWPNRPDPGRQVLRPSCRRPALPQAAGHYHPRSPLRPARPRNRPPTRLRTVGRSVPAHVGVPDEGRRPRVHSCPENAPAGRCRNRGRGPG